MVQFTNFKSTNIGHTYKYVCKMIFTINILQIKQCAFSHIFWLEIYHKKISIIIFLKLTFLEIESLSSLIPEFGLKNTFHLVGVK